MTANLEALARALYNGCGWTSFAHNLTLSASPPPTWEEADGHMKAAFRHVARAACEFICGKDEKGEVIVPEPGAVVTTRTRLRAIRDHAEAPPECKAHARHALHVLGGDTE